MSGIEEALKAFALTPQKVSDEEYARHGKAKKSCWGDFQYLRFGKVHAGNEPTHSINFHAISKNREELDQRRDEL